MLHILKLSKLKCILYICIFVVLIIAITYITTLNYTNNLKYDKENLNRSYIFNFKQISNYDAFVNHVLEQYKGKKVIALTYDDGPRQIYS